VLLGSPVATLACTFGSSIELAEVSAFIADGFHSPLGKLPLFLAIVFLCLFFWLEPKEPKVQGIRRLADCRANAQRLRDFE
jgi:hypothetical protein